MDEGTNDLESAGYPRDPPCAGNYGNPQDTMAREVNHFCLAHTNMKVILVNICLVIVSDCWGGAEAVVYDLAKYLRAKGHAVTVLVNHEIMEFYQDLEDIQLFDLGHLYPFRSMAEQRLRANWKYDFSTRLLSLFYLYLDELHLRLSRRKIQRHMVGVMSKNHVQVIHSHLPDDTFLVSSLPMQVPRVATIHGLPSGAWSTRCKEGRYRKALIMMDVLTTVSVFTSEALHAWERRFEKLLVIPNGIDVSGIQAQAKHIPTRSSLNLLFPGGARPVKGGLMLIKALAAIKSEMPHVHAYLAGQIPRNHPIRKMVREFQLESNTTFTGFLRRQQYLNLLKSVDLLVMPSQREAMALVYLEAMALGKPIVAGKTSSIPETVKDGRNGILVNLSARGLSSAVVKLCRDRQLTNRITRNNLRDVAKFDWGPIVDRYVDLYRELAIYRNQPLRQA
jgi:glycosyltransferase involved in cell wall biosynthesis